MNDISQSYISAAQIRAGRSILDWSQEDLAQISKLSIATIRKLELGHISPRHSTTHVIREAFEDAGLEFIDPEGVRRRPEDISVYQGFEGTKDFFDDVYQTMLKKGGDLVAVCPSEDAYFVRILNDYRPVHEARMTAIKDKMNVRCILTEDKDCLPATAYCEYRWMSKHYVDSVPFYVYGNKFAIIVGNINPNPKITVIKSPVIAQAYRRQFYSMWEKATILNGLERDGLATKQKCA